MIYDAQFLNIDPLFLILISVGNICWNENETMKYKNRKIKKWLIFTANFLSVIMYVCENFWKISIK